jgi:hypothetical protein
LSIVNSFAQKAGDIISGTVVDNMGPVMMANVVEIDASNRIVASAVTDMNGNFSFKLKNPKDRTPVMYGLNSKMVKEKGKLVGLALKPKTPAEVVWPYLDMLDMVLVMTVEPGFGGQKFMADMLPKIRLIRAEIERRGLACDIEVDGGIAVDTAPLVKEAGANVLVAGSSVFGKEDRAAALEALRNA